MKRTPLYPMLQALLAAVLFGASAPFAKVLLGDIEPVALAALLYLGSGAGLWLFRFAQRLRRQTSAEAPLARSDFGWLIGAVVTGGVLAPIVLLFSLRATPAATASLLLNFEGVATTLIAALVFHEAIGRRAWWAILCVTMASMALSLNLNGTWGLSLGAVGVLAACVLWGIDNNFTRNISGKDPLAIVTIKGLGAGTCSLVLALWLGNALPPPGTMIAALILGSLSYGLSVVLSVGAMRSLGAARTSALFGTAPLAGVAISFLLFGAALNLALVIALPLMVGGALLLLNEQHAHTHTHAMAAHDHRHQHDDGHHTHEHPAGIDQAHAHWHTHDRLQHAHDHLPDTHHRHGHADE